MVKVYRRYSGNTGEEKIQVSSPLCITLTSLKNIPWSTQHSLTRASWRIKWIYAKGGQCSSSRLTVTVFEIVLMSVLDDKIVDLQLQCYLFQSHGLKLKTATSMAQSVKHCTMYQKVACSIPSKGTYPSCSFNAQWVWEDTGLLVYYKLDLTRYIKFYFLNTSILPTQFF